MTRRAHHAAATVAAVAAFAGGGCTDPYEPADSRPGKPPDPPADTVPPAVPADPAPGPSGGGSYPRGPRTPRATFVRAAVLYGNWTARSADRQYRRLLRLSAGEARAQLTQDAASNRIAGPDPGARARARVVAITVKGDRGRRRAVIVTREQVDAPDLPDQGPAWRVTLATAARQGGRWVITRWAPQP